MMSRYVNTGVFGRLLTAIVPVLLAAACSRESRSNPVPAAIRAVPAQVTFAVASDVGVIGSSNPELSQETVIKQKSDWPGRRAAVVRQQPSGIGRANAASLEHAHLAVERLRSAPSASVPYRLVPRHAASMRLREHAPVSARMEGGARSAIVFDLER